MEKNNNPEQLISKFEILFKDEEEIQNQFASAIDNFISKIKCKSILNNRDRCLLRFIFLFVFERDFNVTIDDDIDKTKKEFFRIEKENGYEEGSTMKIFENMADCVIEGVRKFINKSTIKSSIAPLDDHVAACYSSFADYIDDIDYREKIKPSFSIMILLEIKRCAEKKLLMASP